MLTGRILLTGGAGFLGRGIMRRAREEQWDAKFVVYSRDEQKHAAAKRKYPEARYVLGDILDTGRLALIASMCDYVIHTAAIKYIPECEAQPSEAIRVNVDGTRSVIEACRAADVQRCVIISTDKAAAPVNTYGMTKALCERLVFESLAIHGNTKTSFVACRYGNVIGSTGSVWPVFKLQRKIGRLSVTDPDMTRFFISINDAVDVICATLNQGMASTVLIPEPKALRIGDLASYLEKAWLLPQSTVVGRRPGEKSHEAMIDWSEHERIVPRLLAPYWVLYGPTKQVNQHIADADLVGMVSSGAQRLSPEDFVQIAEDSESV